MQQAFYIVKTVFCPNSHYLKISLNSLFNLLEVIKLNIENTPINYNYTIYITGWVRKKEFKERISFFISKLKTTFDKKLNTKTVLNIILDLWLINKGKNHLFVELSKTKIDGLLFYLDHDILLPYDLLLFDKLYFICNSQKHLNFGYFALNQEPDCRHQFRIYENTTTLDYSFNNSMITINYPNHPVNGCIASGCFVLLTEYLHILKDIPVFTVYGFDDYYITKLLENNNIKVAVVSSITVTHPYDNINHHNDTYKNWKKEKIKTIAHQLYTQKNISDRKHTEYYYKSMQSSINLWS